MAAGPRVVFVRFETNDSPKLTPWVSHARRVVGDATLARHGIRTDGHLVWQLVSANNRELMRGVEVHATFEEARASASRLAADTARLAVVLVSEPDDGLYGWYLTDADRPVATCARWYATDRDRRNSILLARRSIPEATPKDGARLTDPTLMMSDVRPGR